MAIKEMAIRVVPQQDAANDKHGIRDLRKLNTFCSDNPARVDTTQLGDYEMLKLVAPTGRVGVLIRFNGRPVAHFTFMPLKINVEGHTVNGMVPGSYILEAFRRKGIGQAVYRQVLKAFNLISDLKQSPMSNALWTKHLIRRHKYQVLKRVAVEKAFFLEYGDWKYIVVGDDQIGADDTRLMLLKGT